MKRSNLMFLIFIILEMKTVANGTFLFLRKYFGYRHCTLDISSYTKDVILTTEQLTNYQKVIFETEMVLVSVQKFIDFSKFLSNYEENENTKLVKVFSRQKFVESCVIHLYIFKEFSKRIAFEQLEVLHRSYKTQHTIWPSFMNNIVKTFFILNGKQNMSSKDLMLPSKWEWPIKLVVC